MISYRLPGLEVSVRKALEAFGINFSEISKFSCCPEPNGIKNANEMIYITTAARNLALAEARGKQILTPCNGCFETLKGVRSELRVDHHLMNKVNSYLDKIGLKFTGKTDVYHLVEFFHKLGSDVIKDKVRYPLNGLRIAVHYGCHFLRPSAKIQMDDPMEPHIFDKLIEDLGATSVEYVRKMDCCGGSLDRAGNRDAGLEMINKKLSNMKDAHVDAIVTSCPECFKQFDFTQRDLKKLDYTYDIPVLYYSELLCIALGIDIKNIIKKFHRIPVNKIFEKVDLIQKKYDTIKEHFDIEYLKNCYTCGACNNDCPVAKTTDFNPQEIVGKILDGKLEDLIKDPSIWMCLDCYVCYELCPMRTGLVDVFTKLRNLATKNGHVTDGFKGEFNSFMDRGIVPLFSHSVRKRMGLQSAKPELDDLKKLLNEIEE